VADYSTGFCRMQIVFLFSTGDFAADRKKLQTPGTCRASYGVVHYLSTAVILIEK